MNQRLEEKLNQLPTSPGVYQYYDAAGTLLYVGKAKNLKKRVSSYFQKKHISPWTDLLVQEINDLKFVEVKTELEAFMLENSFIKSLRPKYNLQLRDDKTFPFLRISHEDFPTFSIVRRISKRDKARFIGPFLSATYIRTMLKIMQELFGIKTASVASYETRSSVPNQIGLGARNLDNRDAYLANVEAAIKFLSEPQPQAEKRIKTEMAEAASTHQFERAAILRDKLLALQHLRQDQSLFGTSHENRDYIGIKQQGKLIAIYILCEREGKITNHFDFLFEAPAALTLNEQLNFVISYLYTNGLSLPKYLVMSDEPTDSDSLKELLSEQADIKIEFVIPKRGDVKTRLETAEDNAAYQLKLELAKKSRRENGLTDLARILSLPKVPKRIEAFDISNLGPTNIVGASIVFINGQPNKNEYRKYNINTPEGQDDFASMRELVYRRLMQSRELPDLLLIDGGKGQLSAALDARKLAKKEDVPMVALAKKEELLYLPGDAEPIVLDYSSDALLLLTGIRDEVHRFVISFHRFKRRKKLLS